MRRMGFPVFFFALILLFPLSLFAQKNSLSVTEIAITTRILKGDPADSVRRISSTGVHELYCFTKVVASDGAEREIIHVWYRNNEIVAQLALPVKGISWRTYSKKTIEEGMSGDWRVEARDASGNLLKTVTFKLN
jgi:hypothetical protein